MSRAPAALALAVALCLAAPAQANLVLGDFLGFTDTPDNDSEAAIESLFGFDEVIMLARIQPEDSATEDPIAGTEVDGLSYDNFVLNDDNEPAGGEWSYAGPELVDLIAVKAGPNWGVWRFTDANTDDMRNMGLFNTLQMQPGNEAGDQRGFGDVTAYQIVPEPSVAALVGAGLLGLALRSRGGRR